MGGSDILAGGQHVLDPLRDQAAQRNLERPVGDVDIVARRGGGVKVDAIGADADAVEELLGALQPFAGIDADMVLGHREQRLDAAAFADIGGNRQAVERAHHASRRLQPAIAVAAVMARRFGLHPVEHGERELARALQMLFRLLGRNADDGAPAIVDLRPVHEADVGGVAVADMVLAIEYPPVVPVVRREFGVAVAHKQRAIVGLQRHRIGADEGKLAVGPEIELEIAPDIIIARALDGVVLVRVIAHGEAPAHRLLVIGVGLARKGRRLAGLGLAFRADDVLDIAELQKIAKFGGVDEIATGQHHLAMFGGAHGDGGEAVAIGLGGNRFGVHENRQPAGRVPRRKQGFDRRHAGARFRADRRDVTASGVEVFVVAGLIGQRVVVAVVIANVLAKRTVARRRAVLLDPRIFIRRHGLRRQLAAEPFEFLGQDDAAAEFQRRKRRCDPAQTAADDDDVAGEFLHFVILSRQTRRNFQRSGAEPECRR